MAARAFEFIKGYIIKPVTVQRLQVSAAKGNKDAKTQGQNDKNAYQTKRSERAPTNNRSPTIFIALTNAEGISSVSGLR